MRSGWLVYTFALWLPLSACDSSEQLIELSNENHALKQEIAELNKRLSQKTAELDDLVKPISGRPTAELQQNGDAGANPEADAAWAQFNRAAQELADVRDELIQKSEQFSLQSDEQVKLETRVADNAQALSDALGALGQANARAMLAEQQTAPLDVGQREADPTDALLQSAREVALAFQERLKAALQMGIQAGGPAGAIDVCKLQAGPIAQTLSKDRGWEVGRVSMQLRNPANQPSDWESQVLQDFERKLKSDPAGSLETSKVEGGRFYFMSGIKAGEPCLVCHGVAIAPDVQARLHELYPEDKATGYALGDLRGAFSLSTSIQALGGE